MTETPLVDAHTAHLSELENKTVIGCLKSLAGFGKVWAWAAAAAAILGLA